MTATTAQPNAFFEVPSHVHRFEEVRLSQCNAGCKYVRCACGAEGVDHSAIYGCEKAAADGDFREIEGPTIATVHRKWLDCGLPASTLPTLVAQWRAGQSGEPR